MKNRKKTISLITLCLAVLFVTLHLSPEIAIRTHLFVLGHPIVACSTDISENTYQSKEDKESLEKQHVKKYLVSKAFVDWGSGNSMVTLKVTSNWFLYFADIAGEA